MRYMLTILLLGIVGLLIIMLFVSIRTQGDSTNDQTTTTTIANEAPVVSGFELRYLTSSGDPVNAANDFVTGDGESKRLHANFTITDANGCNSVLRDIPSYTGAFMIGVGKADRIATSSFGDACDDGNSEESDNDECIQDYWTGFVTDKNTWTCTETEACSGALDNSATINCYTDIPFYADAGEWIGYLTVQDDAWAQSSAEVPFTMPVLSALDINNNSIPYGVLTLGATSTELAVTITNTGNDTLQPRASQTDFVCDTGGIVASATRVSSSTGLTYANMTQAFSNTLADVGGFTIDDKNEEGAGGYGGDEESNTSTLYLKLQVPTTGARGSCTATTTFQASAAS